MHEHIQVDFGTQDVVVPKGKARLAVVDKGTVPDPLPEKEAVALIEALEAENDAQEGALTKELAEQAAKFSAEKLAAAVDYVNAGIPVASVAVIAGVDAAELEKTVKGNDGNNGNNARA